MHEYAPQTSQKIHFTTVPGDPVQAQMLTLENGLKLFLSVNRDEPRVYTEIAVRAGSKHDPADTTGLAHYFEHMMFKGTDRMGTLNWTREKELLDLIEHKFEEHRNEQDPARKKQLYAEIDRLSFEAARFAAANEYDKLVSAIGAKGTNAYTWVEQTVYVNDIPSNELERWFELESERFRRPVLRLFHTELETVFEEYNISQDKDFRKTLKALQETLTPTHPYGTQTTLGRGEDLKNPSQTNIYRFFNQYYVPNNMAVIMSGDFDPEEVAHLAQKYFGSWKPGTVPSFSYEKQPELTSRVRRDVYGNEAPWIEVGWRFPGAASPEALMLPLIAGILHNYQAGLFDLNIIQQQKLLEAWAYPRACEDFSSLLLMAKPRDNQSLEEVENLLMEQIDLLREGRFDDWLPQAVVRDMKLGEIRGFEKNQGRAGALTGAFILGIPWSDFTGRWKMLEKVTKDDIVTFARQHIRPDNYVTVYKHQGEDKGVMKVEKPEITPIEVNREGVSDFAGAFLARETPDIEPRFLDFSRVFQKSVLSQHVRLRVVNDKNSKVFRLHYCFDMGKTAERRLGLAASYLSYLGTSKFSPRQVQQEFYRLGLSFSASCQDDYFFLTLEGLSEHFDQGVALLEHLIADARPNAEALENLVADTILRRENEKSDKRVILSKAMASYARYGPRSPFSDRIPAARLAEIRPEELTDLIRGLFAYKHDVLYCGPGTARTVGAVIKKYHPEDAGVLAPLKAEKYPETGVKKDRVLFVHFPMVQTELLLLSKGTPKFSLEEYVLNEWYNQYFGYGLSSIVFQEIRESKALAYSAYAHAGSPAKKNRAHWLQAYVGTQPDKLREAIEAFQTIMEDMPVSLAQMETARQSVLKQIAASRITRSDIFWTWRGNRDKGFSNRDLRRDIYEAMMQATSDDLIRFHHEKVKGRKYTWLVLGDRDTLDFKYLKKIGKVTELKPEEIFGE